MKFIECKGKMLDDCFDCEKYYSFHSWHYDRIYNQKVLEITCSIGGHKVFNENEKQIIK